MKRLLLLALVALLTPTSAHAVTAMCTGGFNQCDPTTGTCYTAWDVTHAGQVQAQCASDPTSCWRAMLGEPTCAPVPPTNPQAIRVCPPLMDCGPNFPPGLWGMPDYGVPYWPPPPQLPPPPPTTEYWWRNHDTTGKVYADIACYVREGGLLYYAIEPKIYFDRLAGDALHYYYYDLFGHPGLPNYYPHCPACTAQVQNDMARLASIPMPADGHPGTMSVCGDLNALPGTPFEPPGGSCSWVIRPAASGTSCVNPASPLVMALKVINVVGGRTTSEIIQERHDQVLGNIVRTQQNLRDGLYGSINSIWARAERMWRVTMIAEVAQLAQALIDPPDSAYQSLPPVPVFAPSESITTADGTVSAVQADAWNAWAKKHRLYMQTWDQLHTTYDHLAGAMVAQDGWWVRVLARFAEDVAATLGAQWTAEQGKRAALAATYPTHPDLRAGCDTPTDVYVRLRDLATMGARLFGGFLSYQAGMGAPCAEAPSPFSDAMTSTPADLITAFSTPGIRHRVGAATGFDSSRTVTTLTGKQNLVGKINITVKVAAAVGEPFPVKAGDVVRLTIPGLPAQPDAVLAVGNTVLLKVAGVPPGIYTATVTYPDQRSAKVLWSTATITVSVL